MKNNAPVTVYILFFVLVCCAMVAWLSGSLDAGVFFNDPSRILKKIFFPLMKASLFISIGLFAGQIIEGAGWTKRVAVIARPFMRWGHLSGQMGAAFTTAFVSGTLSLSMLRSFHEKGPMDRKELQYSILLNTFPSFFLHLPRTFFILLALAGRAGAMYMALAFCAAMLRFVVVLCFSHFTLPEPHRYDQKAETPQKNWKVLLPETGRNFLSQLIRILMVVVPVYLTVVLISEMGFFLWLRESLAGIVSSTFIPIEAMSVIIISLMVEFTSGYAAAGAMLEAGTLNVIQTVTALVIGYVIASPVRALRHQMPYYMGIFNPSLGLRLMLISQAFRVSSMVVVGFVYVWWMI